MAVGNSAGRDIDRDGARDVLEQPDQNRVATDGADRRVNLDVALVDFDAGLRGDCLGNFCREAMMPCVALNVRRQGNYAYMLLKAV